jgi:hypothetical protein
MDNFIEMISSFIGKILVVTTAGASLLLLAGELRLASLKKASQGSSKLSAFTERMTGTNWKGGGHGTRAKSP